MLNFSKLLTPNTLTGKILVLGKTIFDSLILIITRPSKKIFRVMRLIMQLKPLYTMVSNARLINLYDLAQEVNALNLQGDIVECGVWNGGSAAMMAVACRNGAGGDKRKIWLFDSFQGHPPPDERDGKKAKEVFFEGWNRGDIKKVREIFDRLGIPGENVKVVEGWFDSTLKAADIDKISLLHIDADWYASVKVVLENLYNKVVPGGFIALDDYGHYPGCRKAVKDYIDENRISGIEIKKVDSSGVYLQKPELNR